MERIVAGINQATTLGAAGINAGATRYSADQHLKGSYAQAAASRYMADASKLASMFGSVMASSASRYSADQSRAAQKYSADISKKNNDAQVTQKYVDTAIRGIGDIFGVLFRGGYLG